MNKRRKAGTSRPGKGTVSAKALMYSLTADAGIALSPGFHNSPASWEKRAKPVSSAFHYLS
jgi:hypothetical protein